MKRITAICIITLLITLLVTLISACSGVDELSESVTSILALSRERGETDDPDRTAELTAEIMNRLAEIEEPYFALSERRKTFLTDRIGGAGNLQLGELWDEYYAGGKDLVVRTP